MSAFMCDHCNEYKDPDDGIEEVKTGRPYPDNTLFYCGDCFEEYEADLEWEKTRKEEVIPEMFPGMKELLDNLTIIKKD